jgi:hypothetical protein
MVVVMMYWDNWRWSRVLLENPVFAPADQEVLRLLWNPVVHMLV